MSLPGRGNAKEGPVRDGFLSAKKGSPDVAVPRKAIILIDR